MAEIIQLETGSDYQNAMELAEMLKGDEVTHGLATYRTKDGRICYRFFGESEEHLTYIFGLLERLKLHLYREATR